MHWVLLVFIFALGFFLARSHLILQDPDTYWHIATGRWIVAQGKLPPGDVFSFTVIGKIWILYEWAAQVLLALAYDIGAWPGVVGLCVLSAATSVAILARHLLRHVNGVVAASASLAAVLVLNHHLLARPHVLAWPVLVLWSSGLIQAADERRAPSWWLVPVMVLWANLHGSYVIGLGLAGLLAAESLARLKFSPELYRWAAFLAASLMAALLTPEPVEKLLRVLGIHSNSIQLSSINEWAPAVFGGYQPIEIWLALFIGFFLIRGLRLPLSRLILLFALIHMALAHVRHAELMVFVAPLLVASSVGHQLPSQGNRTVLSGVVLSARGWLAVASVVLAVFALIVADRRADWRPPTEHSPVAAVQGVRAAGVTGRVFNDYDFGGFLVYNGIPTFIDGRSELFGDAFMKAYLEAAGRSTPESLRALLDSYQIEWTLLKPSREGVSVLDKLPEWRRVYADEFAVAHVRHLPSAAGSKPAGSTSPIRAGDASN